MFLLRQITKTALGAFFLLLLSSQVFAGVTITPNTVVIEGRERYADVTLVNQDTKPNTYEMGWRFNRQDEETGKYQSIDKPTTEWDLSQNAVFSPKRITLMPGTTQKVRLALRLKGEPPAPGDYRGHLEFKEASPPPVNTTTGKPQVGINIRVGFAVPVVYRVGESNATAQIGQVSTQINPKNGKIEAVVPIIKSQSPYGIMGELEVFYKPNGGEETNIGGIVNANIFPEITRRTFRPGLRISDLKAGTLRIVYKDRVASKNLVYTEKTIRIGQ